MKIRFCKGRQYNCLPLKNVHCQYLHWIREIILILQAFQKIDTGKKGYLTLSDIQKFFNSTFRSTKGKFCYMSHSVRKHVKVNGCSITVRNSSIFAFFLSGGQLSEERIHLLGENCILYHLTHFERAVSSREAIRKPHKLCPFDKKAEYFGTISIHCTVIVRLACIPAL